MDIVAFYLLSTEVINQEKYNGDRFEMWPSGTAIAWHAGSAGFESPRGQRFGQP